MRCGGLATGCRIKRWRSGGHSARGRDGGIPGSPISDPTGIRDKRIDACVAIVERSTEMLLALLREQRLGGTADWTAWNQALAGLWLVGSPRSLKLPRRSTGSSGSTAPGSRPDRSAMRTHGRWPVTRWSPRDWSSSTSSGAISCVPSRPSPIRQSRGLRIRSSSGCRGRPAIPVPQMRPPARWQLISSERRAGRWPECRRFPTCDHPFATAARAAP